MFIEMVDVLRCTRPHADTYLVAAPRVMSDRTIVHGILGCPVCGAEYSIVDAITFLTDADVRAAEPGIPPSDYEALRCGALLDLQGHDGFAILTGDWGAQAPLLLDAVNLHLVLLNPPATVGASKGLSIVVADGVLPFAAARARGVALSRTDFSRSDVDAAASLVRSGGRLVAPADFPLPANARLLASDDRDWVAEVTQGALLTIVGRRRVR
jgi:hypothetical protein